MGLLNILANYSRLLPFDHIFLLQGLISGHYRNELLNPSFFLLPGALAQGKILCVDFFRNFLLWNNPWFQCIESYLKGGIKGRFKGDIQPIWRVFGKYDFCWIEQRLNAGSLCWLSASVRQVNIKVLLSIKEKLSLPIGQRNLEEFTFVFG